MGVRPTKRVAYLGVDFALVPIVESQPHILIRVRPGVMLFDCDRCKKLAGEPCVDSHGKVQVTGCNRGNWRRGKPFPLADRIAMCGGLIAAGRFDEIHVLNSGVVLRAVGELEESDAVEL